ncbi:nascent polypeptide-associated complex subunit alpha, muscle-specific form-like isoform X6 [Prunus avium]|uniref:Nascent polypeptide-associated complex subunit alpha, muscle-specific form-like isoform X5 n=1 Tax=Prunus avium TaxID=42229 RepID=A0A6P5RVE0_PRUAV|nr:nascent polypeptide-associated complex subunit alpha, muscle-specific form-like isoform X5 [Prunus avium]XP_021807070.1 nascent polypeptide-associated complex subunit alpha, muscle-specific form-like isoform X6 [Prunus avium]
MGVVMPAIFQLVNLCVIGFALALQGSAGLNLSPSPEPLSVNPPIETAPAPLSHRKSFTSNVPIPALQPNGSDLYPPPAMPPLMSAPVPQKIKGQVPSLSPSIPEVLPPDDAAPPPLSVEGHVPSVPPNNAPPPPSVEGHIPPVPPNNAPSPPSVEGHVPSVPPNNAPPPRSVEGHVPPMPPNNAPPSPSVEGHVPPMPPNNAPPSPSVEGHIPPVPPNNAPPSPSVEGHIPPVPPNNAPPSPSVEGHIPPVPPNNAPPSPSVEGHIPPVPPNNAPPSPSVEGHIPPVPPNNAPPSPSVEGHIPPVPPNNAPPSPSVEGHIPPVPPNNAPPPPSAGHVPPVPPNNAPPPPSAGHVPPVPPNNAPPPPSAGHVPPVPPNNAPPPPSAGHVPPVPPNNAPPPPSAGHVPSVPPNNAPPPPSAGHVPPVPPNNAPPPPSVEGHVPSVPPNNAPPPPRVEGHVPPVPPNNAPPPPSVEGHVPSVPPNNAPPPLSVEGHVPSVPPTPQTKAPVNKSPISVPVAPVPIVTPSGTLPQISPAIHSSTPDTSPLSAHQRHAPNNKVPIPEPLAPAPVSSLPRTLGPNPPVMHPSTPNIVPPILPVPVASPTSKSPQNSPSIHPVTPGESPSTFPDPEVSPASSTPPSINWKRNPVVAPPYEAPKPSLPMDHTPAKAPSVHKPVVSSPPSSTNWKRGRIPVVAPSYEAPKPAIPMGHTPAKAPAVHKPVRHYKLAPAPSDSSPEPPFDKGHSSPASSPSTYKNHHARNKVTSPALTPSYLVSPSTSKQPGPVIPPASHQTGRQRHYGSPPLNPGSSVPPSHLPVTPSLSHVAPAPSPSLKDAPHYTKMPPKLSPSGSTAKSPEVPPLPLVRAFPPPPPNEDCSSTICTDPYTNTPPGSPCGCVLPLQVGLRLSVALYTFFPLVSELAQEIAVGVFMQQSQVRIIGANAATQQPEKTVALIDLVPLGEKFDNTTAFLTSQRFWHKQVVIKASYFGDYDVLYVRYPGLPPSPPSSDVDVIYEGPYPGNNNNGRTVKPLGVDVHKKRNKNGLSGGIIAIIALSTFAAVALCSAAAWVFLFKHGDCASEPTPTPQALLPSVGKPSGTAGSMSRHSSVSLSFGSSIATYTGSANTFSASDIERATDNFDPSRILGEGGFGRVYSGVLEDETKIAVKVLKRDDQQGGREFLAEVEMLSRLHHRNLVKLIGICTEEHSRSLVYELIPNGSVESHLHGIDKDTAPLNWAHRMKIALGAARGLAYLHEDSSPRVIHRDFKASNILLEDDFTPKVSDFGLARTAMDEENRHISTRVMGTFGYVAPEYAMTGHLLVKSDVYSYGVVLLELLTGRKPVDMSQPPGEENLVAWARPLLTSKEGLEAMVDPNLGDVPFDSIAKVAAIASMCVQPEVSHRPFMGEVVQALKLVCNEFDEAKEIGSRSSSRDDLSIDVAAEASTASGQLPDTFQSQYSILTYDSELETEREGSPLKLFSTSMSMGRQDSESFRRHSSSGPLGTGRSKQFWERLRRSSRGSVSEHGFMLKLWQGSH